MPGVEATQRLPRLVGEGHAMRLVLSGELVDAEEAADVGVVEEVHGDDDFDDPVYELAGAIAEKSPIALQITKKAVKDGSRIGLTQGPEYEAELFARLFAIRDKDDDIDAFFEDREPE